VVDGNDPEAASAFSVEAFEAAVQEDKAALAKEFGVEAETDDKDNEGDVDETTLEEAVKLVRDNDSPFNWLLAAPC